MIYLLCSTIRPKTFKVTHAEWMIKCDDPTNVVTKVIVDSQWDAKELKNYDVAVFEQDNKGITKPITRLTQSLTGLKDDDIIIVMSDDFFPPKHWDSFLGKCYSDFSGALSVFDGGPPEVQKTIITIPIMDYYTLKRLNKIVYHPAYTHMFSDNELYDNIVELGLLKIIDPKLGYTFEHRHWTNGGRKMDTVDVALGNIAQSSDGHIYKKRKKLSLKKKLAYTPAVAPALSILICTMPSRKAMLDRLLSIIEPQLTDEVELLIESDDGKMPIGAKRDKLLRKAKGRYVAFIDDDDMVSPKYVDYVLQASRYKMDSIGIEGVITSNGLNPRRFIHSMKHKVWSEENGVYLRSPNHCNPIKREIACKVGFNCNKSFEEDKEYSQGILPLLKGELFINIPIYGYLFKMGNKDYI